MVSRKVGSARTSYVSKNRQQWLHKHVFKVDHQIQEQLLGTRSNGEFPVATSTLLGLLPLIWLDGKSLVSILD